MKTQLFTLLCATASLAGFSGTAASQSPCKPPEIIHNRAATNIFTEEQDLYLGDALAETIDKELSVIADENATAYVREIGERLARHLPQTSIRFRFFVVDAPELNAYSVAGGRIYVSRKLVSFVKSEDELAGIIGHEMGHAIVRHHSADLSKLFKEILGVERFSDRNDVYEKVHQLIERHRTKRAKPKRSHEDRQQIEADQIGVYAMTAAGYDPNANVTAWERLTEVRPGDEGRSGLFGNSKPEHKRLREMLRSISGLSADCRETAATVRGDAFRKWQSYVLSIAKIRHSEHLPGLISRGSLQPYLRGSIKHLQFSPDGQYVIAQDASGVNILRREPFGPLFRINIDDAKFANFSPDSKRVYIQTYGLRVEAWDIQSQRPMLTQEVYVRESCVQTQLSPDGKTLVCFSSAGDLHFIDVETSEKIHSKSKFYSPTAGSIFFWLRSVAEGRMREAPFMEMEFSPDGRYFLGGTVYRPPSFSSLTGGGSNIQFFFFSSGEERSFIAFDVKERKEIKVPDGLKEIVSMPFAFYSNDKIIGQHRTDPEKSGIFNFPGGGRVEKFFLNARSYETTASGDHLIVRPVRTEPAGVYSVSLKKFVLMNKTPAIDGHGDMFVSEGLNGTVDLIRVSGDEMEKVATASLPKSELGDVETVAVSDQLDRLALSEPARGAVWDLKTGARKIYIRGFTGSFVDPAGGIYADLPPYESEKRSIAYLDMGAGRGKAVHTISKRGIKQMGPYLVRLRSEIDEELEKLEAEGKKLETISSRFAQARLRAISGFSGDGNVDTTLEVSDAVTGKLIWSRLFKDGTPQYAFSPDGERVTLYWPIAGKAAKEIIRRSTDLSERARRMGQKEGDYLVQVLNAANGTPVGELLIETGQGSFRIKSAFATGDWLTVSDSENRVLFYSIKDGELKARVFGEQALVNPATSVAVVGNFPGVLSLEQLETGRRLAELRFPSSIVYVRFTKDGSRLFVLTAAQQYYVFDTAKLAAAS